MSPIRPENRDRYPSDWQLIAVDGVEPDDPGLVDLGAHVAFRWADVLRPETYFTAYLVAFDLRRKPVLVKRLEPVS